VQNNWNGGDFEFNDVIQIQQDINLFVTGTGATGFNYTQGNSNRDG